MQGNSPDGRSAGIVAGYRYSQTEIAPRRTGSDTSICNRTDTRQGGNNAGSNTNSSRAGSGSGVRSTGNSTSSPEACF